MATTTVCELCGGAHPSNECRNMMEGGKVSFPSEAPAGQGELPLAAPKLVDPLPEKDERVSRR